MASTETSASPIRLRTVEASGTFRGGPDHQINGVRRETRHGIITRSI